MINASDAYKEALVAFGRRSRPRAIVDITDPDLVLGTPTSSEATELSDLTQLTNHVFNLGKPYATLEQNRWALDGSFAINEVNGEIGFESENIMDEDGEGSEWVLLPFSGVDVLQNLSVYFSDRLLDGIPEELTIEVLSENTVVYSETIADNESAVIKLKGFTAYLPTGIRVTVTKWSLPYRRVRVAEIVVGVYEIWGEDDIVSLSVEMQTDFTLLTLPYSTCTLGLENISRRFDPRNKDGMFASLEERQAIQVFIGMDTSEGVEYVPVGTYYQYDRGWANKNNASVMSWYLVDVIGLLQQRWYNVPDTLPTTLEGWVQSVLSHLGATFSGHYEIAEGYADMSIRISSGSGAAAGLVDKTCADILLWICQVAGLFPRANVMNGYLRLDEYWDEGPSFELDNLSKYPAMSANGDIAELHFKFPSGSEYVAYGTSTTSPTSGNIENPFITSSSEASPVAKRIISEFGGNMIETVGRGDPTAELGDVVTVELDDSVATTGRLCYQFLTFKGGVLRDCKSKLLQSSGIMMYTNRVQFMESGTWTVPEGVTSIRIILVGKGEDGERGDWGEEAPPCPDPEAVAFTTVGENGAKGADGSGGRVWSNVISVSSGASYSITVGDDVTFANYSSANGVIYPNGYTDINSGESFARTGVDSPIAGSGDGGRGGAGGSGGRKIYRYGRPVATWSPTNGLPGDDGATGSCVIYWEDPEE